MVLLTRSPTTGETMRAVVRREDDVALLEVPRPVPRSAREVLVRVELAGICRTDLYVARGLLACTPPVILGHELSGVVEQIGGEVSRVRVGDRVAADPFVPGTPWHMIGVQRDGAFAEFITLPEDMLHVCPPDMTPRVAAYTEPVAASMAPLRAPIHRNERGLVFGHGRIAALTGAVLRAAGFEDVQIAEEGDPGSFDFVVETRADRLTDAAKLVRDGGVLVLKSRAAAPVSLDLLDVVRRELRLHGAHYGCFDEAIRWLHEERLDIAHLLGPEHPLDTFEAVFTSLMDHEAHKHFLRPGS